MRTAATIAIAVALLLTACGSDDRVILSEADAPFVPVLESSDLAVGDSRIVLTLLDRDTQPTFPQNTRFRARFFEPTEGGTRFLAETELEAIAVEGETYYVARDLRLEVAGDWALAVTAALADGSAQSSPRLPFTVTRTRSTPTVGDSAPNAPTPTTSDAPIGRLSGDPDPLSALYERSSRQLLDADEAFLIVFATYDRCAGRPTCARAVEQAKRIARDVDLTVIHVEPFGRQQPAQHQALIDAVVEAWGIRVEPQLFFVDAQGQIAQHFAIVVTEDELSAAAAE